MKSLSINYWGVTKWWWALLIVGVLMVLFGFAYWFWPMIGYAVSSQLFGWLLVAAGVVHVCVSAKCNHSRGWVWWLVGGVLDIFIGFMLVRSVVLSEAVFPYFIALIFLFWGISAVVGAVRDRKRGVWWLYLINGVLMLVIGFFMLEAGWIQDVLMTSILTAIAFIYWGFSIAMLSYDMRPRDLNY